jgi:hypothetical protein
MSQVRKAAHQRHYPKKAEISLFNLPTLLYRCLHTLKQNNIGYGQPEKVMIENQKVQVHIHYFPALDTLNAEQYERGVDLRDGLYVRYRLPVCAECDIVWVKLTGIWGGRHVK